MNAERDHVDSLGANGATRTISVKIVTEKYAKSEMNFGAIEPSSRHPGSSNLSRTAPVGPFYHRFALPVLALAVFLGAMGWAKSRDPFERVWFTLKTSDHGFVRGIAVLPKPVRPCPVAVYLHGSSGDLMKDGNTLRQLAELGLAAVGMEYDQTNQAGFDAQFIALQNYIRQQSWALTNATAWIASSLAAQRTLSFALSHPEAQPQLLVRLSGGWVSELGEISKAQGPGSEIGEWGNIEHPTLNTEHRMADADGPPPHTGDHVVGCPVLLVHGEKDEVFPVQDVRRLADLLKAHGVSVTTKILPDRGHGFEPDRALVTRLVGEYCKAALAPNEAFNGMVERQVWPFWVYFTPAFTGASFWLWRRNGRKKAQKALKSNEVLEEKALMRSEGPRSCGEKALRWVAFGLAVLAVVDSAMHLIPPRLKVDGASLNMARKWLVLPKWRSDFESLADQPIWQGQRLKTLLDHVELANYNRNELINWKVSEEIYQEFVLSPAIYSGSENLNPNTLKRGHRSGEELNWRRPLWENFYPHVRHERSPEAAAKIVVRYLRERVTIAPTAAPGQGIESIWKRQVTDEKGFETIYVAALRSVGIGARLNASEKAEFWTGEKWAAAPRLIAASFL